MDERAISNPHHLTAVLRCMHSFLSGYQIDSRADSSNKGNSDELQDLELLDFSCSLTKARNWQQTTGLYSYVTTPRRFSLVIVATPFLS